MTGSHSPRQGLGCLGMSELRGPTDDDESIATLHRAVELGVRFFDTADSYGGGHNEELLGRALRDHSAEVTIATKFGIVRPPARDVADPRVASGVFTLDGRPEHVRAACEGSLRRLRVAALDVFLLHRVDPTVTVPETVGAMAELVAAGKVRRLGLSEPTAANLREAQATHPISYVESEWSLWKRDVETGILPLCRELGITLVAYSPLGRGFLTGTMTVAPAKGGDDGRAYSPWFAEANFAHNASLAHRFAALAHDHGCTPAQLALAWLHHQGDDVIPVPGARRRAHLEQNAAARAIDLSPADLGAIETLLPPGRVAGTSY